MGLPRATEDQSRQEREMRLPRASAAGLGWGASSLASACQSRLSKRKWGEIAELEAGSSCGESALASQTQSQLLEPLPSFTGQSLVGCQGSRQATFSHTWKTTALPGSQHSAGRAGEMSGGLGDQQHRAGVCLCFPSLWPASELGCDLPPARASDLEDA